MTVFLAASDESSGATSSSDFQYAGWLAPEQDWSRFFIPAWQERVLDTRPKIPYVHVTEMRSRAWREKYGISCLDAEQRLDEAAKIIATMGSLYPLKVKIGGSLFRELFQKTHFAVASGARKRYEPDYNAFLTYAYAVLCRVRVKFPDAERVDFLVEQKSGVTKHTQEFFDTLPASLRHIGRSDLIPLLGTFTPGSKETIPLQAADFLCWHSQRADTGTLEQNDILRWNPMARKKGLSFDVPDQLMKALAQAFEKYEKQDGTLSKEPHKHKTTKAK
jgi:hypothetical protein